MPFCIRTDAADTDRHQNQTDQTEGQLLEPFGRIRSLWRLFGRWVV